MDLITVYLITRTVGCISALGVAYSLHLFYSRAEVGELLGKNSFWASRAFVCLFLLIAIHCLTSVVAPPSEVQSLHVLGANALTAWVIAMWLFTPSALERMIRRGTIKESNEAVKEFRTAVEEAKHVK